MVSGPYQPSNSTKLKFYGLYKQATDGKNNVAKPGFWDVVGRAKWEAWNKHGDMSKEDAMNQYVDCLKEVTIVQSFFFFDIPNFYVLYFYIKIEILFIFRLWRQCHLMAMSKIF